MKNNMDNKDKKFRIRIIKETKVLYIIYFVLAVFHLILCALFIFFAVMAVINGYPDIKDILFDGYGIYFLICAVSSGGLSVIIFKTAGNHYKKYKNLLNGATYEEVTTEPEEENFSEDSEKATELADNSEKINKWQGEFKRDLYNREVKTARQSYIAHFVPGIIFIILGIAFILPCAMIFTDGSAELVEKLFVKGGLYFALAFIGFNVLGIFLFHRTKCCKKKYKELLCNNPKVTEESKNDGNKNKKKQKSSVRDFKRKTRLKESCKEKYKLRNKEIENKLARLKYAKRIWLIICIFIWVISFILTVTQILHPKYFFPIAVYPLSILFAFDIPVYLEKGVERDRIRGKIVNSFGLSVAATLVALCMATIFLVSITLA